MPLDSLNFDDQQSIIGCRPPDATSGGTVCPPPSTIIGSDNVAKALQVMMALSNDDGLEHGAWLFLNPNGTIRVGTIYKGTATQMPQLALPAPAGAIGEIHTHTNANGPSDFDLAHARYGNIYGVVGTVSYIYLVEPGGQVVLKKRRQ